jgi:hypothetical protein
MKTPTRKSVKVLRVTHNRFSQIKRIRKQSHQVLMDEASKLLLDRVRAEKCAGPTGSPNRGGKDVPVDTDVPTTNAHT